MRTPKRQRPRCWRCPLYKYSKTNLPYASAASSHLYCAVLVCVCARACACASEHNSTVWPAFAIVIVL